MDIRRMNVIAASIAGIVFTLLPECLSATISCRFEASPPNHMCSWVPTSEGASWQTGVSSKDPPTGYNKYAYIHSREESWAYLETKAFKLSQITKLSFAVIQERFDTGSTDYVQLHRIPADGSPEVLLWRIENSLAGWTHRTSPELTPEMGAFRLRFKFRVGRLHNLAALGAVVLENEETSVVADPGIPDQPSPELPSNPDEEVPTGIETKKDHEGKDTDFPVVQITVANHVEISFEPAHPPVHIRKKAGSSRRRGKSQ